MSFSIFDLYQSPPEKPHPTHSLKDVQFRFPKTKQGTPDSMRWEDEEPGQRTPPCAGLEGRKGELQDREDTQPRLEESFGTVEYCEDAYHQKLPLMRRKSIYGPSDDVWKPQHCTPFVETHSYTENKKYWDWLNSRNEQVKNFRKTASKPLFAQAQPRKGRKTMPDLLGKEEAPVHLPRKASVGNLQKFTSGQQGCSLDISRSCLPHEPMQRKSLPVPSSQDFQKATLEFSLTLAGTGAGLNRLNRRYATVAKKQLDEASPVLNQGGRNASFTQLAKLTIWQPTTSLHLKQEAPKRV